MNNYTSPYYVQIIIEMVRLLIQFFGALVVAKLTVSWALERFKSEKYWEKTFASYVELIELIDKTLILIETMIFNEKMAIDVSKERDDELDKSYRENIRAIRSFHAKGQLLFSSEMVKILEKVIAPTSHESYVEWLIHQDDDFRDLKKLAIREGVSVAKSRR